MLGVGEGVAVVEVNHQVETLGVGAFGLGHDVGLVAPGAVAVGRGVNPDTQAYGRHAQFLHQGEDVALLAGGVVELPAVGLHLGAPADVGAGDEALRVEAGEGEAKQTK